jgi:hypothetical protein
MSGRTYELPDASDVESIELGVDVETSTTPHGDYTVVSLTPEQIAQLMASLTPYRVDSHPMKWSYAGVLELKCKGAKKVRVDLFFTGPSEEGAFAVWSGSSRRYYRGGQMNEINSTLEGILEKKGSAT